MYVLNRISACLFAIILLWITSLKVVVHFVTSLVYVPSYQEIKHECETSWKIVEDQSLKYTTCAMDETSQCYKHLIQEENKMIEKFNNSFLHNEIVHRNMKDASHECNFR